MVLHGTVHKYAGPPGTGKSTTLLNVVEKLLASGVQPEDIIFTTFTRAGAYEARDRACTRFNLPPARFPYFRTLHSLCFQHAPPGNVLGFQDWCYLGKILGTSFTLKLTPEEGIPRGHTKGDQLMSLWSLSRVKMIPLAGVFLEQAQWMSGGWDITPEELNHFVGTIKDYKKEHGKIDYTDMLEFFLKDAPAAHSPYVVVDEAQDLSPLQWEVVKKLCTHAKETWVAGDDDQCIHEWNGASPTSFIKLHSEELVVLPQSYRIPSSVHDLAAKVINQVPGRLTKQYLPRDHVGKIERLDHLERLPLSAGSWLLLARNIMLLEKYTLHCREKGLLFTGNMMPASTKILHSITTWNKLKEGKQVTAADCKLMYTFMSQRDRIRHGFKTVMQNLQDQALLTLTELQQKYGLLHVGTWSEALDLIPEEDRLYLLAVEKHEGLNGKPRIEISTIHGAKGKEADHVCLITDMTYRTWTGFQRMPDAEHRVWYVGITRARQSLWLVNPRTEYHYDL